jgi:hypothetical protein
VLSVIVTAYDARPGPARPVQVSDLVLASQRDGLQDAYPFT